MYNHNIKILEFFLYYNKITLTAFLDLYLIYCIALEAHHQKTLVFIKENMQHKLLISDLGGMRLH
ncbi:ferric iron reductase, partial [Francisella tularensis subsp. holarctica]|uniref:IucA/IucC family C-terminal-domain containing protein n=1 Tax=Francisella tularensis TaxID=263 RepID=UPI002381BD9E